MFKKLLKGMAFLAVVSIVVLFFDKITRTGPEKKGNIRVSADLALFGATDAITGPGLMDRVAERMLQDRAGRRGPSFAGARDTAGIAPGGTLEANAPGVGRPPPGAPGTVGSDDEDASPEESERARLRRIRMLEIERGERRMYGGTDRTPSTAASSPAFRRRAARPPSDSEIAAQLSGFVDKLKRRATDDARAAPSVGSNLEEADRLNTEDGDVPVLTLDGVDSRLEQSPALRALQQLNKDGASSLRMSRRGGMTDGSRDKAGKRFDGNEKTMDSIPIEEVTGAFGKKQIKTYGDDGGSVRDLK